MSSSLMEDLTYSIRNNEEVELPHHLARLPGSEWALWRCVGLRGAGFPITQVLELSSAECATVADALLDAQDAARQAQGRAVNAVNKELDALRNSGQWEKAEKRDPLFKAIRSLKNSKSLPSFEAVPAIDSAIEEFRSASAYADSALPNFQHAFKAALDRVSHVIQDIARTDRFREAIIWQNRNAFHTGIAAILRRQAGATDRGSKQRQHEELVANYLQRYSTKNDTIGFFGPVGWANLTSDGEAIVARPGPALLEMRKVYFEGWGIDSLAEILAGNKAMQPWLAPRRMPFIRIAERMLHQPLKAPSEISVAEAAILQACDGNQTAKEIASHLICNSQTQLGSQQQVYDILDNLRKKRLISWAFEIPVELYPERTLRRLIERVGDESLREPALEALNELEAARNAIASATGDAEKLDQALGDLEATFTRLTGVASTRAEGKTYASRTLVYEDCRRDIELEIGPETLKALEPAITLLLASARWFTFEVASSYRKAFKQIYDSLVQKTGSTVIDAADFWFRAQPLLFGAKSCLVNDVVKIFQERWSKVLSVDRCERRVEFTIEELRPRVLKAFDAPCPGWKSARYHSPDVMIAASSIEAIRQGDYQFVLGELHVGVNTLGSSLFMAQHPAPQEFFQALELDLPEPRIMPVTPKYWLKQTTRTSLTLISPSDYRLETAPDSPHANRSRAFPIAELVIEDCGDGLVVKTRDGRLCFDIIEFFGETLNIIVPNIFKILPPGAHTPRVTFDRFVVCRESWSFSASEIEFADEKLEEDRFLQARRWARANGLPRFVFVKTPVEVKPFYVDFDSPIYIEVFAKMIRRTIGSDQSHLPIAISEMLPRPDQIWLPDAEDQRYTSELRMVAVDLTS